MAPSGWKQGNPESGQSPQVAPVASEAPKQQQSERICKRCYRQDDGCPDCGGTGILPERRSAPRIHHVYTPEENAAFEERMKSVLATYDREED